PRPIRTRSLRAPCLSAIWLSFITSSLAQSLVVDHADEMFHFADHAARHRGIRHFYDAPDLVQPEPDQGLALGVLAPLRAAGLLDLDALACHDRHSDCHLPSREDHELQSATTSLSTPVRRDCNAETLILRRCATERGES